METRETLTFEDIQSARDLIAGKVLVTPVRNEPELDRVLGCSVFLKCDQLQPTGAFKLRGASHAIARLRLAGNEADVATHSSGNHGAALALAARRDGRTAHVVMPSNAVPDKIESVRANGGQVTLCEPSQAAREAGLARLVQQGLVAIPPYDHPHIIAGQGTSALELIEAVPGLTRLVTPLGGGGLLAGTTLAARGLSPGMQVFGAEPEGAADGHASLAAGKRVTEFVPDTIADGLRAVIGKRNFAIIKDRVAAILLVSDAEIESAMRLTWELTGLLIEPSSAVAIAAIQRYPDRFAGRRTGVILTGGNVDRSLFPWLDAFGHA